MSTAITDSPAAGQRITLFDVEWPEYEQISDALRGRNVRLTYDRGSLEFLDAEVDPVGNRRKF